MTASRQSAAVVARVERMLPAPPDVVYRALTEPATMVRWMSPFGRAEVAADVRPGGRLHVAMVEGDVRIEHAGVFLELDPPRRLSFTWRSEYTGTEPSVVTVELVARGASTWLVLTHERLPGEAVASHEGGWRSMLERLAELLEPQDVEEASG
ncbi:MAG: SRPBCC domain-containing protein [Chloroflexota bacterium]